MNVRKVRFLFGENVSLKLNLGLFSQRCILHGCSLRVRTEGFSHNKQLIIMDSSFLDHKFDKFGRVREILLVWKLDVCKSSHRHEYSGKHVAR